MRIATCLSVSKALFRMKLSAGNFQKILEGLKASSTAASVAAAGKRRTDVAVARRGRSRKTHHRSRVEERPDFNGVVKASLVQVTFIPGFPSSRSNSTDRCGKLNLRLPFSQAARLMKVPCGGGQQNRTEAKRTKHGAMTRCVCYSSRISMEMRPADMEATDSKCMLSSSSLRGKAVMILTNGLCLGAAAAFDIVSMKEGC